MKTLIAYATKHGTTKKCASMLAKRLTGDVDLYDLKAGGSLDLAQYEKVIIGGSIYVGKTQKEVSGFCSQNLEVLKGKKLGLFICCMLKNNVEMQLTASFPKELLDSAAIKGCLGAEIRPDDMGFGERFMTKMVTKMTAKSDPSLPVIDMKNGTSMISEDVIDNFAQVMNND